VRAFVCLLALALVAAAPVSNGGSLERTFDAASDGGVTHWTIEHDTEDGSGNAICIMTAAWLGKPISIALRKDSTKDHYALRFLNPAVSFSYGVEGSASIIFDRNPDRSWAGPVSGVADVFDFRIPTGTAFIAFEQQFLTAHEMQVVAGGQSWTATLTGTYRAYALLQECLVSVLTADGRW
jgi:hypothetical protein